MAYGKAYYEAHKEQVKAQNDAYRRAHPEVQRKADLKRKFSISMERYQEILQSQGGCCRICKSRNANGRALAVDHDHKCCAGKSCGKCIRGLVCENCNRALGLMKDSPEILRTAAKYLEDWSRTNLPPQGEDYGR